MFKQIMWEILGMSVMAIMFWSGIGAVAWASHPGMPFGPIETILLNIVMFFWLATSWYVGQRIIGPRGVFLDCFIPGRE